MTEGNYEEVRVVREGKLEAELLRVDRDVYRTVEGYPDGHRCVCERLGGPPRAYDAPRRWEGL